MQHATEYDDASCTDLTLAKPISERLEKVCAADSKASAAAHSSPQCNAAPTGVISFTEVTNHCNIMELSVACDLRYGVERGRSQSSIALPAIKGQQ